MKLKVPIENLRNQVEQKDKTDDLKKEDKEKKTHRHGRNIAVLALMYLFMEEEPKNEKLTPKTLSLEFPAPSEILDTLKSKKLFQATRYSLK